MYLLPLNYKLKNDKIMLHIFFTTKKSQVTIGGKDIERLKPSSTADENVKWYSSFSKQSGRPSSSTPRYLSEEHKNPNSRRCMSASLVVQWLRIHLPMQGTQVRALVREDPTCRGTTKPMHPNY